MTTILPQSGNVSIEQAPLQAIFVSELTDGLQSVREALARIGGIEALIPSAILERGMGFPSPYPVVLPVPHDDGEPAAAMARMLRLRGRPVVMVVPECGITREVIDLYTPAGLIFLPVDDHRLEMTLAAATAHSDAREYTSAQQQPELTIRTLFSAVADVILLVDEHGRYQEIAQTNPMSLYRPWHELIGRTFHEVLPTDIADRCLSLVRTALISGDTITAEYALDIQGAERWFEARISRMSDTNVVWVARDITSAHRDREALAASERRFRSFIESIHEFVMQVDEDGSLRWVNQPFISASGHSSDDVLQANLFDLVHPDDTDLVRTELLNLFLELKPIRAIEYRVRCKNGSWLTLLTNADVPRYGEARSALLVSFDVTERKQAEREIYLLAHALKSIHEGVCITDMTDTIIFVNDAMNELYGYEPQELVGKAVSVLRSPDNSSAMVQEIYPATLRSGWQGELLNCRKDGSEFPVFISTSTVRDEIGRPVAMIGVTTDITERRHHEAELRAAHDEAERANRLKSEFLANMSHEIRTPLNIILGCTNLLEESISEATKPEYQGFFSSIAESGKRLLDTIQKIIDVSRFHISDFPLIIDDIDVLSVAQECTGTLEVLARSKGLELAVQSEVESAVIRGDMYAITHAITNVIENAIKYTDAGSITVTVLTIPDGVEVRVDDTGIGIGSDYLPFIFDEFSQEKGGYGRPYEGTGLGLALTRKFIEACGGDITVESHKGLGSSFRMRFPVADPRRSSSDTKPAELSPLLRKAPGGNVVSVLLVEDDTATQQFMRVILAGTSIVHAAESPEDARRVLASNKVDVVIIETSLGRGDVGLQLARSLRASDRWANIPIIGLSALPGDVDRQRAIEAGCDAVVSRPFRIPTFIDLVLRLSRRTSV